MGVLKVNSREHGFLSDGLQLKTIPFIIGFLEDPKVTAGFSVVAGQDFLEFCMLILQSVPRRNGQGVSNYLPDFFGNRSVDQTYFILIPSHRANEVPDAIYASEGFETLVKKRLIGLGQTPPEGHPVKTLGREGRDYQKVQKNEKEEFFHAFKKCYIERKRVVLRGAPERTRMGWPNDCI